MNGTRERAGAVPRVAQLLGHLRQDLVYALRSVRRSPVFSLGVIATLALGVGTNAAMFGVVDQLMFRPLPYLKDPGTTHRVYLQTTSRGARRTQAGEFAYTRFTDIRDGTSAFVQYAAFLSPTLAVGMGDAARERRIGVVSGSFWSFFTAQPAVGRFFSASEDTTPRGADVVVLGHAYWRSEFGARTDVIGTPLLVNNVLATIIGVAPEGFVGVDDDAEPPALYMPITAYRGALDAAKADPASWYRTYNTGWVSIMVRRKPGVSIAQASADLTRVVRDSYRTELEQRPGMTPLEEANPVGIVSSIKTAAGPDPGLEARTALYVSGVAAVVFLVACANIANLFLSRALERQREMSVRLALGASRSRLVMQTLTESFVLASLGSVAGLLIAFWGAAALRRLWIATDGGAFDASAANWRTVGVAVGAALVATVLTGIAPAFVSVRDDLARTLKSGVRGGSRHWTGPRTTLLVLQGALSVVLLIGALLFVRSFANVRHMRLGYNAEQVLFARTGLRGARMDSTSRVAMRETALNAARAIPGVEAASWVYSVPFRSTSATRLFVAGIDTVGRLGRFTYQASSPGYFQVMGTRIVRGRAYTDADRAGAARVMVVSESMGRTLWPGVDPVGQCVRVGADTMPCTTVIGVAEDIIQNDLQSRTQFHYYMPIDQFDPAGGSGLFVKMRGDLAQNQEVVRRAIQAVMPGQTFVVVTPLMREVVGARRSWQLGASMFTAFGGLALLVAAIGLYGVIGYNVTQRKHELSVRVALGAQPMHILRLVVGQGMGVAFASVVIGSVTALAAGRWLQPLLFQQSASDPTVYVLVAGTMMLVALLASASPSFRAAKADPNAALRSE